MKIPPYRYVQGFCLIVIFLAIYRACNPEVASEGKSENVADSTELKQENVPAPSTPVAQVAPKVSEVSETPDSIAVPSHEHSFTPHRILSVGNFEKAFPDSNSVQLSSATKLGIEPVYSVDSLDKERFGLIYVGSNPYYQLDNLNSSVPYLVPKAADLLQKIGSNFLDSLYVKGVPAHKILVSSVLRTKSQVEKLRTHNENATQNSCHMYATTFDIPYYRYVTVEDPDGPKRRVVSNDTLQWVLSEVLRDLRNEGRCYVKYEKKQSCFHITVR